MIINRAYVFRLYPTREQQILINQTLGCSRLVYNHYLNKKIELYKENKSNISCYDCIKDLKNMYNDYPFLKDVDSMSLRCVLFDLDSAYKNFFKGNSKYPKFKNRNKKNTYRTNMIARECNGKIYNNIKIDLESRTITLPKLKNVKIRGYRNLDKITGRIINATIIRESDGTYYVSVLTEEDKYIPPFNPTRIIGLDLGVKDLVVTSEYEKYNNEKVIEKYEKRIKRKQRELARKDKGSNNYNKTKQQLAILYSKLSNARKYIIHKITKEITDDNDIIVTETLKVSNMLKNHNLAKSIQDASFSEIIRQLTYKAKWKFKKILQLNTFYPSSQICSHCEYKNDITKNLNVREYECPNCYNKLDRDFNSSVNIMFEGIKLYTKELLS